MLNVADAGVRLMHVARVHRDEADTDAVPCFEPQVQLALHTTAMPPEHGYTALAYVLGNGLCLRWSGRHHHRRVFKQCRAPPTPLAILGCRVLTTRAGPCWPQGHTYAAVRDSQAWLSAATCRPCTLRSVRRAWITTTASTEA